MLLVLLTVSMKLLGTILASGERCSRTCEVYPWGSWSSCSSECGGTHKRTKSICCNTNWDYATCILHCNYDRSDFAQTAACGPQVCDFMSWGSWGSCNPRCGGHHSRSRSICCSRYWSTDSCLQHCSSSRSALSQSAACSTKVCDLLSWGSWGSCNSTCDGRHSRSRSICCNEDSTDISCLHNCNHTLSDLAESEACGDSADRNDTSCLENCRLTEADILQTIACSQNCVFGAYSNSSFKCHCEDQGYGDCCEFSDLTCSDNPCKNNAACVNGDQRYECQCTYGWSGLNCNVEVLTTTTPSKASVIEGSGD
ncbi:hypothetical protein LSAT2_017762 [Lamellibrachia satsuma]|nr:hypothetical protein LSAT2_017762 [Lamellibrachia satsuma]